MSIPHISIISSSVRLERNSHRVSLYFQNYLTENKKATADIIDLQSYQFPIFDGTMKGQKHPPQPLLEFAEKITKSDGIIIVTPEYNGGYPASLKNVVDVLYDEWHLKPIGISTVSIGMFGGSQCLVSLQFSLWKMHAWTIPATFPVPNVTDTFDELGKAIKSVETDKLAGLFVKELLWCIEAKKRMAAE